MPEAAALGFAVQVSSAPGLPLPGGMERVTGAVLEVMVLPWASWIASLGWVAQAIPPVPPPGCWVKPSCAAAPGLTGTDTVPVTARSAMSFTVPLWLGG